MCSAGRRVELLKDFKKSMSADSRIIATDLSKYAPAIYEADKYYLVPRIDDPTYIDVILDICKKESINAVTTLIDPEIMILAENRLRFEEIGVEVLAPYEKTARLCFDKYEMYKFLSAEGIPTVRTWGSYEEIIKAIEAKETSFPVFVKPRRGSGSVGAKKIEDTETLKVAFEEDETLIAQEYMDCLDLDADIYVDTVSHKPVAIFSKKKISTTIGGANKTVSFKDQKLFDFVEEFIGHFEFNGPLDADFFYKDGQYYLSEINPRFGGAYLHAYGAGVDFITLIENNLKGSANDSIVGEYAEGIVMMMYDSVIIKKEDEMA
ncbi:MAG: ATP-grasp domain-containing protein [Lachnospiraceae bacterium]|nr:ATP-grasp domain-containing protein [Lachnospiraceae bacterium]